ncbi:GNAT family N-acetyltransferase [Dactylosporangium fulvum]|uniref:GNAT family N-acetyltransferase n=1 Tax=Dactylosporangium fulvum TaxID=53359 RepID=A0ABY5W2T0_9ACTN|nr:GNAT family N-acetyltransferase [Dactylosporangium fulvum]UWP83739.1 GNAT family N-acetyltransferase [Dactylosporangium fulvum]
MLGPQHVGQRVVVRRFAGIRDARPVFSDILGYLVEATETHLTVRARTGAVRVPTNEIARAKVVPARRRFTPTEAIEHAAAAGWRPKELATLGDWMLRATDGWTQRGNSALAIGSPDLPQDEAIAFVEEWYRERGLPPAMSVPVPLFQRLDDDLARRGWTAMPVTQVMVARLADLSPSIDGEIILATSPSEEWLTTVAGRKGPLPPAARNVLTDVPEVRFGEWYDQGGALRATARGCVADPDGRWLGLSLIGVDDRFRRQGLAKRLVRTLAAWASDLGAQDCYLQVEQRNTPAVALYERLGFAVHHTYSSRRLLTD